MSTIEPINMSHRLRSWIAGAGVVLACAAVPAAIATVETPAVAHAGQCGSCW